VVTSVAFADGDRAVISSAVDGMVREWPLPGATPISTEGTVFVLQSSRDGRTTVAGQGATGNAVRQLDTSDPANVHERGPSLQPPVGRTLSGAATISYDGRLVTAGTTEGGVIIWDIGTAGAPRLVTSPFPAVSGLVGALAFGPDNRWLAVGSKDNPQVALLDLQQPGTPRVLAELDPGNLAQAVAVSANGAVLALATAATDVVLWDVPAGPGSPRQLARLGGFGATVQAVGLQPRFPHTGRR